MISVRLHSKRLASLESPEQILQAGRHTPMVERGHTCARWLAVPLVAMALGALAGCRSGYQLNDEPAFGARDESYYGLVSCTDLRAPGREK